MKSNSLTFLIVVLTVILASCGGSNPNGEAPPIEMGDPATIVTETDSQYLVDVVPDLKMADRRPVTVVEVKPKQTDTGDAKVADKEEENTPSPSQLLTKKQVLAQDGLNVPFPQVRFFIPNIETRYYKKPNLETDFGASYEIVDGEIANNKLIVEGAEITGVYMRYQTIIVARNDLGMLPLESLRKTTDWKKISGKNGVYTLNGLDGKLIGLKVSNRAIKNAVRRDARSRNWSRSGVRQWENAVRNVNNTSQKPLSPELRAVMFKVTGKDKNGRPFQRQLRIDIPIKA